MRNEWQVGVVIPAKNEQDFIDDVISTLPGYVDAIIVVNDGSTDSTKQIVENNMKDNNKIELIDLSGDGVGAAIDSGHQKMLTKLSAPFVSVVMAGDGQMDVDDFDSIIKPIIDNQADYVKGNRFIHSMGANNMPIIRQLASLILGFFTTLAAGKHISDPQCGYTATSHRVLNEWDWQKSWSSYGYPNYWLIELSRLAFTVTEVPVKSVYGNEKSGIKMPSFFLSVGLMMLIMHHKRCFSMLFSKSVTPHSILSFTAYAIGWIAIIPGISTDLERELATGFTAKVILVIACWACAHIFDRLAVKSRIELMKNAQTR